MTKFLWSWLFIRMMSVFTCIQILCDIFGFCVHLVLSFDLKFFLKFGGHIGCQIFILVNLGNIIWTADYLLGFIGEYTQKLLPLKIKGKQTYKKMIIDCIFLKIIIIIAAILATCNGVLHFYNDNYNEDAVYLISFYRKTLPSTLATLLIFIYKCSFAVNPYSSVASSFILSHYSFHTAFQLRLIKGFIEKICDTNLKKEDQYYSPSSQECITQRLKICIMFHQMIVREINTLINYIYRGILSYTIGVLFVGAGMMMTYFSNGTDNLSKVMLLIAVFDGILITGLYVFSGQMLKDESEEIYRSLVNLRWYNMNKKNKTLYAIFLIRSEKPISFDTNLVQVDYLLLVRIFRALYSLSTIVHRATHVQK